MKIPRLSNKRWALTAAALATAGLVVGCGGDDSGDPYVPPPAVTPTVPTSAGASISSLVAYVRALVLDETSEPLVVPTGFTAVTDETSEPLT